MEIERYQVKENQKVKLEDFSTKRDAKVDRDEVERKWMPGNIAKMAELQEKLYAENTTSLLIVFQAMDAAGKDSAIRHVMSGVNPQGVRVWSFKAPSSLERSHDFLWRHYQAVPARGHIGIHNRSHYEEVLVARVHPRHILAQGLPGVRTEKDIDAAFWERRYAAIRAWEEHLADCGTTIMKFFLHMSPKEQHKRFMERLDDPKKNWKFNPDDVTERGHWDAYMAAYEAAINATATPRAPWYVLPADEQWETRALVGRLLRLQLEALDLRHPVPTEADRAAFAEARARLRAEQR